MVKCKDLNSIITTDGGNHYYAARNIPQVLLLHPILKHLIELKEKRNLTQWLADLPAEPSAPVTITDQLIAGREDIDYYLCFLRLLEENHYFDGVHKEEMDTEWFKAADIKRSLANTSQLVFETTEACNLNCTYCSYGELYSGSGNRGTETIDPTMAKKVMDYLVELWNSPLNRKLYKQTVLSFYGGEPTINFPFIEEMVRYARSRNLNHNQFAFSMTTNGTLLDKHMDFLVEHQFNLLVSLDGNELNNAYRHFHDNRPSFPVIYNNLMALKRKHPTFFKRNVNFATVIHDRNSTKEVQAFFKKEFNKSPLMMEVNSLGIRPEKQDEFDEMFNMKYSDYSTEELAEEVQNRTNSSKTPFEEDLFSFLSRYSGCVYRQYDSLLSREADSWHVATGTCAPFEKKVFVTTNGKILPCERILHSYAMGSADKNGVHLDFEAIAEKYNSYFQKLHRQCNRCIGSDGCPYCLFNLNINDQNPVCNNKTDVKESNETMMHRMSALEKVRRYYPNIMRNFQRS